MKLISGLLFGGFFISMVAAGCQNQKPMDSATMMAKADSVANSRMQMVADSMMKDCSTNQSMWIKMKADSMYQASQMSASSK